MTASARSLRGAAALGLSALGLAALTASLAPTARAQTILSGNYSYNPCIPSDYGTSPGQS